MSRSTPSDDTSSSSDPAATAALKSATTNFDDLNQPSPDQDESAEFTPGADFAADLVETSYSGSCPQSTIAEIAAAETMFNTELNLPTVDDVKAEATALLQAEAIAQLAACAAGNGPFAKFSKVCAIIVKGISFGSVPLKINGLTFDLAAQSVSGTIDLSVLFPSAPAFDFTASPDGLTLAPTSKLTLTVKGAFSSIFGGSSPFGKLDKVVNEIGLGAIAFSIEEVQVAADPVGMSIKGIASFSGIGVGVQLIARKIDGKLRVGLLLDVPGASIMRMLQAVLGTKMASALNILQITSLRFGLAPAEFSVPEYSFQRGITLDLHAQFSKSSANPVAKVLSSALNGVELLASITFDGNTFTMKIGVPDIKISKSIQMTGINVGMVAATTPPTLRLFMQSTLAVQLKKDALQFHTEIAADLADLTASCRIVMCGTWNRAFGIPGFAIADVVGEVQVSAKSLFGALELGGTLVIGKPADAIKGKIYFRVDATTPTRNYFFGSVSTLTIGKIMELVAGVKNIPSMISKSGFPDGCTVSFAMEKTTTPSGDAVPVGIQFKGSLNFLGFKMSGQVILAPTSFLFDLQAPPLKLGPIVIARSKTNTKEGPLVHVAGSIKSALKFNCNIAGYVNTPMFQAEVAVTVTSKTFSFKLDTIFYSIIEASIEVRADVSAFNFYFMAELKTGVVKQNLVTLIEGLKTDAEAGLRKAVAKIENTKQAAIDKINSGVKCNLLEIASAMGEHAPAMLLEMGRTSATLSSADFAFLEVMAAASDLARQSEEQLIAAGVFNRLRVNARGHVELHQSESEDAEGAEQFAEEDESDDDRSEFLALEVEAHAHMNGIGKSIKKAADKAADKVDDAAQKAKAAAEQAAQRAKEAAEAQAKAALKAACDGVKAAAAASVKGAMQVAEKSIEGLQKTMAGVLSAITSALKSFDIFLTVRGQLSATNFEFGVASKIRLGSSTFEYQMTVKFSADALKTMVSKLFAQIKTYLLKKIPGLDELL